MKVAYEHLRLKPEDKLTRELAQGSLEMEWQNDLIRSKEFKDDFDDDEEIMRDIIGNSEDYEDITSLISKSQCIGDPTTDIDK